MIAKTKKLAVDSNLLEAAQQLGKHATPAEAVHRALEEYVRRRKRLRITELFGKIDFDESYDYRAERDRKCG